MKTKDIGVLVICLIFVGGAVFIGYRMLFPSQGKSTTTATTIQTQTQEKFTGEIDQTTLDQINKLNDYGTATLDNIGRQYPFGPLN